MIERNNDAVHISIDRPWLVGIIFSIVIQISGSIWWAASTSTRLTIIESRLVAVEAQLNLGVADQIARADKMARLEERNIDLASAVKDINSHLSIIETYLHNHIPDGKR